ncbi:YggS family pyridoxal phosphate-dependent enzyme [Corynebacterium callunae]|uniref:YggS family pyridoxal phosphate-dependent enzyme n=1 Tax=Corynebacterium callunae TaxID=1721 RepID=UPI0039823D39
MDRVTELQHNLTKVQTRIDSALQAAARPAGSAVLLPVTKFHPLSDVEILQSLGVTAVGENREQEARDKAAKLATMDFHMIGQIQSKKVNSVARWAAAVHSIDSLKIAQGLDHGMELALERGDRTTPSLQSFIQLSLDGDPARGGTPLEEVTALAEAIEKATHLDFAGVMCVPPLNWEPERAFAQAREILSGLEHHFDRSLEFSAGMSGDLAEAIMHGSTIVRVGTEILGTRPLA